MFLRSYSEAGTEVQFHLHLLSQVLLSLQSSPLSPRSFRLHDDLVSPPEMLPRWPGEGFVVSGWSLPAAGVKHHRRPHLSQPPHQLENFRQSRFPVWLLLTPAQSRRPQPTFMGPCLVLPGDAAMQQWLRPSPWTRVPQGERHSLQHFLSQEPCQPVPASSGWELQSRLRPWRRLLGWLCSFILFILLSDGFG